MSIPFFSFEMGYSIKRRHLYIVLILIWLYLDGKTIKTESGLILAIIIIIGITDVIDGIIDRWWITSDYYKETKVRNWWKGAMNLIYAEFTDTEVDELLGKK